MTHAQLLNAISMREKDEALRLLASDSSLCQSAIEPSALLQALYQRMPSVAAEIANRRTYLSVFEAAAIGATDRLEELLNIDPLLVTAFAHDGFTALHLACFFGHSASVRALIASGADAEAVSRNAMLVRPIHSAASSDSIDIVAHLLQSGADPDARQAMGFTPLHAAALHGNVELVRLLVEAGADRYAKADDGRDATALAAAEGHDDVLAELSPGIKSERGT